MPFLTDYGLMEFVGTMVKRVFRKLFTLPGRSAIDALASWLSSAPVGVLITIQQYVSGHYTGARGSRYCDEFLCRLGAICTNRCELLLVSVTCSCPITRPSL